MITYIPTYAIKTLGLPDSTGFIATLLAGVVLMLATSYAGHLSDRVGQLRLMIPAAALILVLSYPMFALMVAAPALGTLVVVLFFMALLKATYFGPMGALIAALFPTATRATGMAVGYNVGVAIFGGFTPLIAQWLLGSAGIDSSPAWWVMVAAAVSLVSLSVVRRRL